MTKDILKASWSYIWRLLIVYLISFCVLYVPIFIYDKVNTKVYIGVMGDRMFFFIPYFVTMILFIPLILIIGSSIANKKAYINSNVTSSNQKIIKTIVTIFVLIFSLIVFYDLFSSSIAFISERNQVINSIKDSGTMYDQLLGNNNLPENVKENVRAVIELQQQTLDYYDPIMIEIIILILCTIISTVVVIIKTRKKITS